MSAFADLLGEIERQRGARVDLRGPSQSLRFEVTGGDVVATVANGRATTPSINGARGALVVPGVGEMAPAFSVDGHHDAAWPLHDNARGQVYGWLGIPQGWAETIRRENPVLLETTLNSLVQQKKPDERRMVRALDGRLMAVLSDRYAALDNYDLIANAVLPLLKDDDRALQVASASISDTRLYIQLTTPRTRAEVRLGDAVQSMVTIRNSEFGNGALAVERGVLRLACLNGMVVGKVLRKHHVSSTAGGEGVLTDASLRDDTRRARDEALWLTLRDSVDEALSDVVAEGLLEQQKAAAGIEIVARPDKLVERLGAKFGFTDDERYTVQSNLIASNDPTKYGVIQAVTAAAHGLPADRAYDFQTAGGAILTMAASEWREVDHRN